jgi:excisionase family DNA binding protein
MSFLRWRVGWRHNPCNLAGVIYCAVGGGNSPPHKDAADMTDEEYQVLSDTLLTLYRKGRQDLPLSAKLPDGAILLTIEDACEALSCGKSKVYELIADGNLVARKIGSATRIEAETLRRYVANLPRARGWSKTLR